MTQPRISPVERYLRELHARFEDLDGGAVADYIPELAKADPRWFGICIATVDGQVYAVGDTDQPFTIQSISKPFAYGLALEDRGKPAVLDRIGVEPTGDAFNEISLAPESGRPLNPMINAGAITATSLVLGESHEDRWNRILALFSIYAGRKLELDDLVYRSERDTGHRNRAISHMLRNFDILEGDPEPALDLYFRQCSIEVTCRDLSIMAATLASGGVNPVTRERAIHPSNVDEVLSLMTTCGMYDYAGEWVYRVGLPAKSGVAGGILAVLPGQIGIGVFSPRLDPRGNSVRGVAVCEAFSEEMEMHFLRAPRVALSTVRSRSTLLNTRSKRARHDGELIALGRHGHQVVIYQLQGDLTFAGIEIVARHLVSESETVSHILLDLSRVHDIDPPASSILVELLASFGAANRVLGFVGLENHTRLFRTLQERRADTPDVHLVHFDDFDLALEWYEDQLLTEAGFSISPSVEEMPLEKHEFLDGLSMEELEVLRSHMERRDFPARRFVVRQGDRGDELLLVTRGELSVLGETSHGHLRRLATLSPGMGMGEQFVTDHAVRSAFVRSDSPSTCWVLSSEAFTRAVDVAPGIEAKLLRNLLRSAARIIDRLSIDNVGGNR